MNSRVRNRFLYYLMRTVGVAFAAVLFIFGGLALSKIYFDSFNPFFFSAGGLVFLAFVVNLLWHKARIDIEKEDFYDGRRK
jgi:hypothetical protein